MEEMSAERRGVCVCVSVCVGVCVSGWVCLGVCVWVCVIEFCPCASLLQRFLCCLESPAKEANPQHSQSVNPDKVFSYWIMRRTWVPAQRCART